MLILGILKKLRDRLINIYTTYFDVFMIIFNKIL